MKHNNKFRCTVTNTRYFTSYNKITCVVNWIDVFKCKRRSVGVAMCHPDDDFNETFGKHLAESRAKYNMYDSFAASALELYTKLFSINDKYVKCWEQEEKHIKKLLNEQEL